MNELGYADAVRFIWQYEAGWGDYTEERRSLLLGWTLERIAAEEEKRLEEAPRQDDPPGGP